MTEVNILWLVSCLSERANDPLESCLTLEQEDWKFIKEIFMDDPYVRKTIREYEERYNELSNK